MVEVASVSREEYQSFRDDIRDDLKSFKSDIRRELIYMFAASTGLTGIISGVVSQHLRNGTTHAAVLVVSHIIHIF